MAESRESSITKYIIALLTIIGFVIAAVLWAVNSHVDIKEWTIDQDMQVRKDIKETLDEQYVPATRFIKLETQLEEANKTNAQVLKTLDEVKTKIDKLDRRN